MDPDVTGPHEDSLKVVIRIPGFNDPVEGVGNTKFNENTFLELQLTT